MDNQSLLTTLDEAKEKLTAARKNAKGPRNDQAIDDLIQALARIERVVRLHIGLTSKPMNYSPVGHVHGQGGESPIEKDDE